MWKKNLRTIHDEQLLERLKNLKKPLKKPTYDEVKKKRRRADHRRVCRYRLKQTQEPFKGSQTQQTKLGEEQSK